MEKKLKILLFFIITSLSFASASFANNGEDHYRELIQKFEEELRSNPKNFKAQFKLGNAYLALGDMETAISHFKDALKFNPNIGMLHYSIGLAYSQKNHVEEAMMHLARAEEIFIQTNDVNGLFVVRSLMKGLRMEYDPQPGIGEGEIVFKVKFGYILKKKSGERNTFKKSHQIPFRLKDSGFRFGYTIESSSDELFTSYFIMETPEPPNSLTGKLDKIEKNGIKSKVARSQKQTYKDRTFLELWFDEGDPLGDWKLQIYINDKLMETIKFTVIP